MAGSRDNSFTQVVDCVCCGPENSQPPSPATSPGLSGSTSPSGTSESQRSHIIGPRLALIGPPPVLPGYTLVSRTQTIHFGTSQAGPTIVRQSDGAEEYEEYFARNYQRVYSITIESDSASDTHDDTEQASGPSQAAPTAPRHIETSVIRMFSRRPIENVGELLERATREMQADQGSTQARSNNPTQRNSSPAENHNLQTQRIMSSIPLPPPPEPEHALGACGGAKRAANQEPEPGPSSGGPSQTKQHRPKYCINCIQKNRRVRLYEERCKQFERDKVNQEAMFNKMKTTYKTSMADLKESLPLILFNVVRSTILTEIEKEEGEEDTQSDESEDGPED